MMNRQFPAALCVLALAAPVGAQVPTGYYLGFGTELPDSLAYSSEDGRVTVSVTRTHRTQLQREMIEHAERLFPDSSVFAPFEEAYAADPRNERFAQEQIGAARTRPGQRWWWGALSENGRLLPFAITSRAVTYYLTEVELLETDQAQQRIILEYVATVRPNPAGWYTVTQELRWLNRCGLLCGMSFSATRHVDFDRSGSPVAVRGDHPHEVLMR